MRIEATMTAPSTIAEIAEHGRALEAAGFDTLLVPEAGHDPFLPLMTLAEHTTRPNLGTGIAVAFPRSPMVVAQLAWDLQRFSGGRLLLGLGTQVRAHSERRYPTAWCAPGPRLREYVQCLRAIFDAFLNGTKPRFEGEHYRFTLLTHFFNPGPIPSGEKIPIYVSAVNRYNCTIAGELCDGIRMHPLNTPDYVRKVIRPAIEEGAAKTGRRPSDADLVANPFVSPATTTPSSPPPASRKNNGGFTSDRVRRVKSRGEFESMSLRQRNPMGKGRHVARQGAFRPVLNDAVNQANALPLAWPSGLERYPPAAHPTRCRHSAFQLSITLKICPTRMRAG